MRFPSIRPALLRFVREKGPIGWYGLEHGFAIPRSEFKEGYSVMTYLEELISDGFVARVTLDGQERFVATDKSEPVD